MPVSSLLHVELRISVFSTTCFWSYWHRRSVAVLASRSDTVHRWRYPIDTVHRAQLGTGAGVTSSSSTPAGRTGTADLWRYWHHEVILCIDGVIPSILCTERSSVLELASLQVFPRPQGVLARPNRGRTGTRRVLAWAKPILCTERSSAKLRTYVDSH